MNAGISNAAKQGLNGIDKWREVGVGANLPEDAVYPTSEGPEVPLNRPKDKFNLMMRLHWPNDKKPAILNGTWHIPPVKTVP